MSLVRIAKRTVRLFLKDYGKKMSTLVTLSLPQGKIVGEKICLPSEKKYYKFFGIPYAKPPIGELRFKNPQPLDSVCDEPLDCTKERSSSLQFNNQTKEIKGSEDCLFLNVRSPEISRASKLPVIVWIHGGAFMTGDGNRHIDYPKYLIEENIVLVTVNYRLGIFGFLSLPSGGISGNFGLKDQQIALKWIQNNIHEFGGDPNNVTLFGQSAGGASVHFQLLSSQSQKYFHKVICHSGLATMDWAIQKESEQKAFKLAELLGFKGNSVETANFLKSIEDYTAIFMNMNKILRKTEQNSILRFPFGPVIEDDNCPDAFLTKNPITLICTENFCQNIPIIMGWTSKEGIMVAAHTPKSIDEINLDLSCITADTIYDTGDEERKKVIFEKIKNFYFNGEQIKSENISELCELIGDICFVINIYKISELHALHQRLSPLYCFKFSYDGKLNHYKTRYKYEHVKGACHGDELYYLFYPNEAAEVIQPDEVDMQVVKKICKLWTNFAKFGNPTPDKDSCDELGFIWNPTTKSHNKDFILNCLDINKEFSMKINPGNKRIEFWRSLEK